MKVTGINPIGQANIKVVVGDTVVAINGKPVLELTYANAAKIVTEKTADNKVVLTMGESPAKAIEVAKPSTGQSTKTSAPKAGNEDKCSPQLTAAKDARTQLKSFLKGKSSCEAITCPVVRGKSPTTCDEKAVCRMEIGGKEGAAEDAKKHWHDCCKKKDGMRKPKERWGQTSCPESQRNGELPK